MVNFDMERQADLEPARLTALTRALADKVRAGQNPPVGFNAERRWHRRIHRDETVDVWLIGWLPTQGTRLHDHGGSAGSFTVVSGELSEVTYVDSGPRAGTLRERTHRADACTAFGDSYVHDVRNISETPAVSVHAYSPPLKLMGFYDLRDGQLARVDTVETDDPEATVPRSLAR